jgi:hypothetical protein
MLSPTGRIKFEFWLTVGDGEFLAGAGHLDQVAGLVLLVGLLVEDKEVGGPGPLEPVVQDVLIRSLREDLLHTGCAVKPTVIIKQRPSHPQKRLQRAKKEAAKGRESGRREGIVWMGSLTDAS